VVSETDNSSPEPYAIVHQTYLMPIIGKLRRHIEHLIAQATPLTTPTANEFEVEKKSNTQTHTFPVSLMTQVH
jgi:hypothetical protein